MKKTLLLSLSLSSLLLASEEHISVGLALAYMNNIVEVSSEQFDQLRNTDKHFKANVDMLYSDTYTISNLSAAYVYNDLIGLHANIPALYNDVTSSNGIGDTAVSATLNIAALTHDEHFSTNLLGFRYTFKTGDENKGLGSGSDSFAIMWDSSGELGNGFYGYASLMWTFYEDSVNGITPGDEDTGWVGIRHKCLLNEQLDTTIKLNWQTRYSSGPVEGYNLVDATLEWSSDRLVKNIPFKFGMKIPVWDSNAVKNEFSLFAGIGGTF